VTGHPESGRIRWQLGEDGILFGFTGTLKPWVFAICPPGAPGDFWMISTSFPLGQPRYVSSEKEARAAAERWLAEFVQSLGAIFTAPGEALVPVEDEPRPAAFLDGHDLAAIGAHEDGSEDEAVRKCNACTFPASCSPDDDPRPRVLIPAEMWDRAAGEGL
jgi:hypothetical protein